MFQLRKCRYECKFGSECWYVHEEKEEATDSSKPNNKAQNVTKKVENVEKKMSSMMKQ